MSRTAMNSTNDNGRVIALNARADAAAAEAEAARASVDRLASELLAARADVWAYRRRLEAIRRAALANLAHCRDERAALALGHVAVLAGDSVRR